MPEFIRRVNGYERDTGKQASNGTGQESSALSDRVEYLPGADWHRPGLRSLWLDRARPELPDELPAPGADDPASVDHRPAGDWRDPGDHHHRDRPVLRFVAGAVSDDRCRSEE